MSKLMIKQIIRAIVALLSNVLERCFKERYFPEPMKRVNALTEVQTQKKKSSCETHLSTYTWANQQI
jgi:hypothetical protein